MPTQIFEITRAHEEPPLTARELKSLLWHNRRGSEWAVIEIKDKTRGKGGVMNYIWVIERLKDGEWRPFQHSILIDSMRECKNYIRANKKIWPCEKFRVRKYASAKEG